jgi:hypothetical protein
MVDEIRARNKVLLDTVAYKDSQLDSLNRVNIRLRNEYFVMDRKLTAATNRLKLFDKIRNENVKLNRINKYKDKNIDKLRKENKKTKVFKYTTYTLVIGLGTLLIVLL